MNKHENTKATSSPDTFTVIAFVLPFAGLSLPGLVLSIIALKRASDNNINRKLAIAGIWVSSIFTVLYIAYFVFILSLILRNT